MTACELHQGIYMSALAKLLMCYKVLAGRRSPLQRSNYHCYSHITQGSPIHTDRYCSGTCIVGWASGSGKISGLRHISAG